MPPQQCSVDDCTKPVNSAGFCAMHYSRLKRWGTTDSRLCQNCGSEVPPRRSTSCSEDCRREMARKRAALWYDERRGSAELVQRVAAAKQRHYAKTRSDQAAWQAALAASRDWKVAHRPQVREQERRWAAANPGKARAKVQRRRARLAAAFVEDVDVDVVYSRDCGVCGICGQGVDRSLRWPAKLSATLDHVIPLSKGGSHEYANVQLAHAVCNSRKNDRIV